MTGRDRRSRWSRRGSIGPWAAAALAVIVAATGCGGSSTPSGSADPAAATAGTTLDDARPHPFTRATLTLVDPTRPTEAGSQTPEHPGRTLVTDVYVPEGSGPFPLVVFAHGLGGNPDKLTELLSAWAGAGYAVVAPAFPLTNDTVPGSAANWRNVAAQPGDVSFVLDTVLGTGGDVAAMSQLPEKLSDGDGRPLAARIDADRIGLGGHSLGGATTYGVTFDTCCRDPRIKAAEVLSAAQLPVGVPPGGTLQLDGHVPLLIVHGEHDGAFAYALPASIYAQASPPVWFVTLVGGTHAAPYENEASPWDGVVTAITTGFWDATIGQVPGAQARFEADAATPGLTTLQHKGA